MATDPWAEFEDVGAAPQGGPVYGPGPKPPAPPTSLQVNADNRAARQLDLAERRFQYQIERDAAKGGAADPKADPKAAAKAANLESLAKQINRVQALFNESQRNNTIPLVGSAVEYLPTQANAQFNSASAGLAEQGLAAFRVPGVGSQSDTELRQFVEANKPSSYNFDSANLERLRTLRLRVDETRASLGLPPVQWEGIMPEDEGLSGGVTYEGPNPANAPAAQPSPAMKPLPEDIDAILAKYGVE